MRKILKTFGFVAVIIFILSLSIKNNPVKSILNVSEATYMGTSYDDCAKNCPAGFCQSQDSLWQCIVPTLIPGETKDACDTRCRPLGGECLPVPPNPTRFYCPCANGECNKCLNYGSIGGLCKSTGSSCTSGNWVASQCPLTDYKCCQRVGNTVTQAPSQGGNPSKGSTGGSSGTGGSGAGGSSSTPTGGQWQCERCSKTYRYVYSYFNPNPGGTCDNPVNGIASREDHLDCKTCNNTSLPLPPTSQVADAWKCSCGDWESVAGATNYCCGWEQNNGSHNCTVQAPDKYQGTSHDSCFNFGNSTSPATCQQTTASSRCCYKADSAPYSGAYSRCSDTYKYCYASWTTNSSGLDTNKTGYKLDCQCNASNVTGTNSLCPASSCSGATVPPVPACNSPCSTNTDCANRNGCPVCNTNTKQCVPNPTVTHAPGCNIPCSTNQQCSNLNLNCNLCRSGTCTGNPPVTVTQPPPACNSPCSSNANCANRSGCPFCDINANKCIANPSPTVTPGPACGITCTTPASCSAAKDGCTYCNSNSVCSAPPACGTNCNSPADCTATRDGCTTCVNNKCAKPPACGIACTKPADCQSAKDGCTTCNSSGVCAAPACGMACTKPADCSSAKDGCTTCTNNKCAQPFNPASCTCDGITYTVLFSGQPVTITSFSKIVGTDVSSAKVISEKFYMTKGDSTTGKIIAQSGDIPSEIIENTASGVRYQTKWEFTLPQLETGATYRIWSNINCQPKTFTLNYSGSPKKVVLAGQTKSSFLGNIFGFFNNFFNLFGNSSQQNNAINTVSSPTPTSLPGKKTIQLETLKPVTIIQKGCSTVVFRQD